MKIFLPKNAKLRFLAHPVYTTLLERDEHLFLKAASENDLKKVVNYYDRGINLETTDLFGWTALMCAAAAGADDVVEFLVNAGAKVDHVDKSGKNATELAKRNRFHNIVEYLESIGYVFVLLTPTPKGSTPFFSLYIFSTL